MWVKLLLRCLSILPMSGLQALGRFGGRLWLRFDTRNAERLRKNAAQAGYIGAEFERAVAEHSGAGLFELAHLWTPKVFDVLSQVRVRGWDEVAQCVADRQGIVLITPHIGAFELLSLWLGQNAPLIAMYRPPNVAWIAPAMIAGRERSGVKLAPADVKGIRILLKHLKNGGMTGILPDQVPAEGADGVVIPVFGRAAWTMTLPAKLAYQTRAKVVVAYAVRSKDWRGFELCFELKHQSLSGDVVKDTALMYSWMEEVIRLHPEQYMWNYHRYKKTPVLPQSILQGQFGADGEQGGTDGA